MRCYVCDKALTETEIQLTPDNKTFEPCSVCMEIIMETAYSDGFVREETLDDPELEDEFGNGSIEVLDDPDTYRSVFDHCDPGFYEGSYNE